MMRQTQLQAISIYAEALTEAGKKIDALPDSEEIGVVFAPVIYYGDVIGFLNREIDNEFDYLPNEQPFGTDELHKMVDLGRTAR